jgi:hypothetical protein
MPASDLTDQGTPVICVGNFLLTSTGVSVILQTTGFNVKVIVIICFSPFTSVMERGIKRTPPGHAKNYMPGIMAGSR